MVTKCNPEQREELLAAAKATTEKYGKLHDCHFKLMDVVTGAQEVSKDRQDMTQALGNVIYGNGGVFSGVSLACFHELYRRMYKFGSENVKVVIKGANAIAFQCKDVPFSDLDIIVYINPSMSAEDFQAVYKEVSVICGQVISKHKQMLDRTFFRPREGMDTFFNEVGQEAFKTSHILEMNKAGMTSCFVSSEIRNASSANSIYITKSLACEDKVVRIDMPHYEKAERLPLDHTPVFCSINDTIRKKDTETGRITDLTLFRIKWGSIIEVDTTDDSLSESSESGGTTASRIAADFVDITVLNQDDSELKDFFKRGGFRPRSPLTAFVNWGYWKLTCSSISECIVDLQKGIDLFDCPETKKDKKRAMILFLTRC